MTRSTRARWWNAGAWLVSGLLLGAACLVLGALRLAPLAVLLGAAVAWIASPLPERDGGTGHWDAQQLHVRDGAAVLYWRPGSVRCRYLLWRLARGAPGVAVHRVDVWADPAGSAFVRDLNDGAERVPTVILPDGCAWSRPGAGALLAELAAQARQAEEIEEAGLDDVTGLGQSRGTFVA